MTYVFNKNYLETKPVLFNGDYSGFQRFDISRYPVLKELEELGRAAFWTPEEHQLKSDKIRFNKLPEARQKVLTEIFLFLTLADSVQNRALGLNFKDHISDPTLEPLFGVWEFFELIHSLSYSHIIRNMFDDYEAVFNSMSEKVEIIERFSPELNAYAGGSVYEKLIFSLFLEGVKFFISFLLIYSIADEAKGLNSLTSIIRLIQHDETLHCHFSAELIKILKAHPEEDFYYKTINNNLVATVAGNVFEGELGWFNHLKGIDPTLNVSIKEAERFLKYRINFVSRLIDSETRDMDEPSIHNWFINYSNINMENTAQQELRATAYNMGQMQNDW